MQARVIAVALGLLAAGCAGRAPGPDLEPRPEPREEVAEFTVTMMDVGTGLAVLVAGRDFSLLYDAGSNDDRKTGPQNRAVAYLQLLVGRSGPASCRPGETSDAGELPIAHVVLSHPHRDHLSLLPDVFRCFAVRHVWESGTIADTDGYRAFDEAASREGAARHLARTGDAIELGFKARARVLSARANAKNPNDASIVLRVELGAASALLMGDAEGGERADPSEPPAPGSVEGELLERARDALDADLLVVGHHGSKTSSRAALLDAVTPSIALVSSGPFPYGDVRLPDAEVVAALEARGVLVRTTALDDERCRRHHAKVGVDEDGAPGGCSAVTVRVRSDGIVKVEDGPAAD